MVTEQNNASTKNNMQIEDQPMGMWLSNVISVNMEQNEGLQKLMGKHMLELMMKDGRLNWTKLAEEVATHIDYDSLAAHSGLDNDRFTSSIAEHLSDDCMQAVVDNIDYDEVTVDYGELDIDYQEIGDALDIDELTFPIKQQLKKDRYFVESVAEACANGDDIGDTIERVVEMVVTRPEYVNAIAVELASAMKANRWWARGTKRCLSLMKQFIAKVSSIRVTSKKQQENDNV